MRTRARSTCPLRSFFSGLAFVSILVTGLAHSSIVRTLNIEDLAGRADRIFSGRCVDVREVRDPVLDQAVTYATFVVIRSVKGDLHGRITIRSVGGSAPEGAGGDPVASVPRFRRGEEVVLFLYADSEAGLTSPVGFGQGKFRIIKDKSGREIALNATGNRTLFEGLSKGAEERLTPTHKGWRGRSDIPPGALLDLAASLGRRGDGGAP